jgi:hypothetical protein
LTTKGIAPDLSSAYTLGTSSIKWNNVFTNALSDGTDQLIGSSGTVFRVGYGASWTAQSFAIGGTEAMRITSTSLYTASGINVGIGTSSPVGRLDVNTSISSTSVNTSLLNLKNTLSSGRSGAELFGISFQALDQTNGTTFTGAAIYALNPNVSGDYDSGALAFYTKSPGTYSAAPVERARITSGGDWQISSGGSFQVGGTAARATTAGTNRIDIFNGTAPVGTLTNGISLYSSSGEAYVMDAAGNATLFSPHDAETNEWVFKSKHTPTGKVLKIDVEKLLRFVNDHFGLDAVHEFIES